MAGMNDGDFRLCIASHFLEPHESTEQLLLKAAKHLLSAATGPEDGPISWKETRDRWMARFEQLTKKARHPQ